MKHQALIAAILLAACSSTPPPPVDATLNDVRLIRYRDANGQGLIPVARSAGETRSRLWQRWLQTYHSQWQNQPHATLSGQTQWCAQWQTDTQIERVCRRDTGLIWFGRGVLHDKTAIQMADKIWALK